MAEDSGDHHLTATVLLPFVGRAAGVENHRPLPIAQIYPMTRLARDKQSGANSKSPPDARHRSMFFTGARREIKDDAFLQRLSRLN